MQQQLMKAHNEDTPMEDQTATPFVAVKPMDISSVIQDRKKDWLVNFKQKLCLNDVFETRNPQAVVEFVPEIIENMRKEELNHMYPS